MKPFLKWVGGKQRSAKSIRSYFPTQGITDYYEPFLGAGAVFLENPTQYLHNHLNDLHPHLMSTWGVVIDDPESLQLHLEVLFQEGNTAERYYQVREEFNTNTEDGIPVNLHAAMFIYLNKHGFNGLCRYNTKGQFNSPFGKYNQVSIPQLPKFELEEQTIDLYNVDFSVFLNNFDLGSHSLIYCDPPYIKESDFGFRGYGTGWNEQDDVRLMEYLRQAATTGAQVYCSNSYTQTTLDLYKGCVFNIVPVRKGVAANPEKRKQSFDYLIKVKP